MSRRAFLVRIVALLLAAVLAGAMVLTICLFSLSDMGTETRWVVFRNAILYGAGVSILAAGLVVLRLRPVLRLLGTWDEGKEPPQALLREAQARALTYPNQFVAQIALIVVALSAISLYVDLWVLGHQLAQVVVHLALVVALALCLGFTVSIGLRMLFREGVLGRISPPPESGRGWLSVTGQIALAAAVPGLSIWLLAAALVYSSAVHAVEQTIASERGRWLQNAAIPAALELPVDERLDDVGRLAETGEALFLLDSAGRVLGKEMLPYGLDPGQVRDLGSVSAPYLYQQGLTAIRVLAVPFGSDRVLCVAYRSQAGTSPAVRGSVRLLALFSWVGLLLAVLTGAAAGGNLAHSIRHVVERLRAHAQEEAGIEVAPIPQTSLDEVGELVRACNRAQQRADDYTVQLQSAVTELQGTSEQRRLLLEAMVGFAAPVIPVAKGLAVVSLAGRYDDERAANIRPSLLSGIANQRARIVVIDLTGIVEATEALATQLVRAARAAELMGCQVVLTGVGSDLAWSLTQMETDWTSVTTYRDLEQGLAYAHARLAAK